MHIDTYKRLALSAESLLGQSVAILGIKGSGKSNTAAVLAEELLAAGIPLCIVDVAGEYAGLKEKFNIFSVGQSLNPETLDARLLPRSAERCAERSYSTGTPVILDVSGFGREQRQLFVGNYMRQIWQSAGQLRQPYTILFEEAHNFFPQRGSTSASNIVVDIAAEGRKRGLGTIVVGQRSARISKDVLTQADVCFLHRVRHPADLKVYYDLIPREPRWVREKVSNLEVGDALVLDGDRVVRHRIRERSTTHYGYTPTMEDIPSEREVYAVGDLINEEGDEGNLGLWKSAIDDDA